MAVAERIVVSRISRYNYGFCYTDIFNPRVHSIEELYWDPHEYRNLAEGQMDWVVKRVA